MVLAQYKTLLLQTISEHILIVTLNRPATRNAINIDMMHDLLKLWGDLSAAANKIRCVILTGSEGAFCSGADLKERKNMTLEIWQSQHDVLEQAMLAMFECPIPVIAAVNGAAFGGGLELVLASDFAYATYSATFAQSEVKIGIMPGAFGTQNLPRTTGLKRAKELSLTGAVFSAQEAFAWNIINKICEPEMLMDEVIATAQKICDNAPLAVQKVKSSLNMSQQLDIKMGFAYEMKAYNELLYSDDREEGIKAFNEKRKPTFLGK